MIDKKKPPGKKRRPGDEGRTPAESESTDAPLPTGPEAEKSPSEDTPSENTKPVTNEDAQDQITNAGVTDRPVPEK